MWAASSFILLLGALAIGSLAAPPLAISGVVAMFGLEQWGQATGATRSMSAAFTNVALGAVVAVALVTHVLRGRCLLCSATTTEALVVALFAYAGLSLTWTPALDLALDQWAKWGPYVLTVAIAAPLLCRDHRDARTALVGLVLAGGAVTLLVLLFANWGYRGLVIDAGRQSMEANPLAISALAGQVLITAALVPIVRARPLNLLITVCLAVACVAVVARSGSRGQLLALFVALALCWPLAARRYRGWRIVVVPVLLIALGYAATLGLEWLEGDIRRWDPEQALADVEGREVLATTLLDAWRADAAAIVFGLGNSASFALFGIYPHMVPAEVLGEAGLIGFALFCAIFFCSVRAGFRALRRDVASAAARPVIAALYGGLVFHFIICLKQGSLLANPMLFLHASLLARAANAALRESAEARRAEESRPALALDDAALPLRGTH
jgi:hypothetical protein